jgi:DNA-binding NtrC family response regulator
VRYKILIVDDEESARYGMRKALQGRDVVLLEAVDLRSARFTLERESPDLVLLDVNLPDGSGIDLLKEVAGTEGAPAVIIITAHGSERIAVDAIRAGAYEYLSKPFELDELRLLVRNAIERARLAGENRQLQEELGRGGRFGTMVGDSAAMKKVFELVERAAATDVTVLIQGESGTGKELVAREVHRRGDRAASAFVALNCAALPDSLIESELFGHEKGAFTGAIARRAGKFELADGGTIFLDEVGDMALSTQAKILRVLEERRFERVGSHETIESDVRVMCATHRDLRRAIASAEFREDLFYRINVLQIDLPPLRERRDDIEPLLDHFGRAFAEKHRIAWPGFTPAARARLLDYPWPGNVRELRNVVERCVVLSYKGEVDVAELPPEVVAASTGGRGAAASGEWGDMSYDDARAAFEKTYFLRLLDRHAGNLSQAAAAVGMHRQTLQYKLKQLGIRRSWAE